LGHHLKLIPKTVPFEGSFSKISLGEERPTTDNFKTTNPVLKEVIADENKFCDLYRVFMTSSRLITGHNLASTRKLQVQSSDRIRRCHDSRSGLTVLVWCPLVLLTIAIKRILKRQHPSSKNCRLHQPSTVGA